MTILLLSSRIRLSRFGLCTIPATPCVGAIVRKPRGRSSSRTTLAAPAGALPFSANFLPMQSLQSFALTSALRDARHLLQLDRVGARREPARP